MTQIPALLILEITRKAVENTMIIMEVKNNYMRISKQVLKGAIAIQEACNIRRMDGRMDRRIDFLCCRLYLLVIVIKVDLLVVRLAEEGGHLCGVVPEVARGQVKRWYVMCCSRLQLSHFS